jgi:hypothetical protein
MSKLTKQLKDSGKATFKGPQVKERKKFAPATKVENPKKGGGSYSRKNAFEEDSEDESTDEAKRCKDEARKDCYESDIPKDESKKKSKGSKWFRKEYGIEENTNISKFIECILTKNYVSANKYIKQAVESKIQHRIEQELSTPLF